METAATAKTRVCPTCKGDGRVHLGGGVFDACPTCFDPRRFRGSDWDLLLRARGTGEVPDEDAATSAARRDGEEERSDGDDGDR